MELALDRVNRHRKHDKPYMNKKKRAKKRRKQYLDLTMRVKYAKMN